MNIQLLVTRVLGSFQQQIHEYTWGENVEDLAVGEEEKEEGGEEVVVEEEEEDLEEKGE